MIWAVNFNFINHVSLIKEPKKKKQKNPLVFGEDLQGSSERIL